jgi:hypothetical protein
VGEVWCSDFDKDTICLGFNDYPDFDQAFVQFFTVECGVCSADPFLSDREPPIDTDQLPDQG